MTIATSSLGLLLPLCLWALDKVCLPPKMPNPRLQSSVSRITAELKLITLQTKAPESLGSQVCKQDLKNLHRDSSSLVSPAAASHPGRWEASRCKSSASALPHSGSGSNPDRETEHEEVPGCVLTLLSLTHLCTSSGLLLGSWLHLWMTWIPMPLADAGCKTQVRRDRISLQLQWDRGLSSALHLLVSQSISGG